LTLVRGASVHDHVRVDIDELTADDENDWDPPGPNRWSTGPVRLVVAPMEAGAQKHTAWAAATLAWWFEAPLQFTTSDRSELDGSEQTYGRLGVHERPMICIDGDDLAKRIEACMANDAPGVVVLPATPESVDLAVQMKQPSFLVPETKSHRLPTGPLVVGMHFDRSDIDTTAVAAVWARHLESQIRLVVEARTVANKRHLVDDTVSRLKSMGLRVAVDEVADLDRDLVAIAETRRATALLIATSRHDDLRHSTVRKDAAISVLACPATERSTAARHVMATAASDRSTPGTVEMIDRVECLKLLGQHRVGRLGYIDDGWPTVIPINYSVNDDRIFIRSLPGHKLETANKRQVACVEVDQVDEWARTGWSVVVHGPLEVITDPEVLKAAWASDPDPWIKAPRWHWLELAPLSITGRRLKRDT